MIDVKKMVEVLDDLSNLELQRREWVNLQESTVYFFSEMISQLFDDTGVSDYLSSGKCPVELDIEVFDELKKLHLYTRNVDQYLPPGELLLSPEMAKVREQAAVVLDMLEK